MSALAWGALQATAHESTVLWPASGSMQADVTLVGGPLPPVGSAATLTLADLVIVGTIKYAAEDSPEKPHVILWTGLGWERALAAPLSYQSAAGVRVGTVLRDLARLAGEKIAPPPDRVIANAWGCDSMAGTRRVRLRDVLASLVRGGYIGPWRADPDGVTRFGARTSAPIVARATQMHSNAAVRLGVYGLDSPRAYAPGNTVDGITIARTVIRETSGKLEADVYS